MKGMHVITGGAGFIGSALLWELNRRGVEDIIIVDNLGQSEKWRNLVHARYADYIHRDEFLKMAKNGDAPFAIASITHLGACSSTTEKNADFLMENNFHYSVAMCKLALAHNARFVNASSAATYGSGEAGFDDDEGRLTDLAPLNMYGYSKHLFDLWLLRNDLLDRAASLKFFNVYGPNEYHKGDMASVASKLYGEILKTGQASLFESNKPGLANGEQSRDFVYVKDCAALIAWLLLDAPHVNGVRNVGTGRAQSFNTVARAVFAALDRGPDIRYRPMPEAIAQKYQNYTQANMGWLEHAGYPGSFRNVESGVEEYVKNYLASSQPYLS